MRRQILSKYLPVLLFGNLFLFNMGNAQVGQQLTLVREPTYKSNQSQVVWYQNAWWGVFRDAGSSEWYVYKYSDDGSGWSWSRNGDTGLNVGSEPVDVHLDESNGKLYVLASDADALSSLTYGSGSFTRDANFPKGVSIAPDPWDPADDPACITQAQDGDLFIFWVGVGMSTSNLMALHSTDQGVTWSAPITIMETDPAHPSALTDAISFTYNGDDYVGVFIGEGKGVFYFRMLKDSNDPSTPSNWEVETLPTIPTSADDHVNIVKDASNNIYMIGKRGNNGDLFYLFKRDNTSNWSVYDIQPSSGGTRPALAIDETYNNLIIFATIPSSGAPRKIQYTVLDKDNLTHVIGDGPWAPVLESSGESFTDVTVSYQILDNMTNIMVCATNEAAGNEVWYNVLNMSDIALPVFLAFFNAASNVDKINLNWATHSEVANYEWIVYRREEGEGAFHEITRMPGAGSTNTITYYHYTDTDVDAGLTYYYRLATVDFDGTIHEYPEMVHSTLGSPVTEFALYPNYPNPFNNQTTIHFEICEQANTVVDIYDISGRRVRRLVEDELMPGSYNYGWNGRDEYDNEVSSGVYALTLSSGNYFRAIRIVLSR